MTETTTRHPAVNMRVTDHELAGQWLRSLNRHEGPRARLACFPHAGGSASFFRSWARYLPEDVELLAVRYPGREDRVLDRPARTMDELARPLARAFSTLRGVPLLFFGHSMGAMVAYQTALRLQDTGSPALTALLVSGHAGPGRGTLRALAGASDDELIDELVRLGGTEAAAFEHPELRELILPVIRADYRLIERHTVPETRAVDAPIVAYYGRQDAGLAEAPVAAWATATRSSFDMRAFEGGHFYLIDHARDLVEDILGRFSAPCGAAPP